MRKIQPINKLIFLLKILLAGGVIFSLFQAASATEMYPIGSGWNVLLNYHGSCRVVVNTCGATIWVPWVTAGEWSSFINYHQGCIQLTECCTGWSGLGAGRNGDVQYNSADGGDYQCVCS